MHTDVSSCLNKFSIELFWLHAFASPQMLREPPITAVRKYGHDNISMNIESHFAGKAIEVEEVDVDTKIVFDGVSLNIPGDDFLTGDRYIIGDKQCGSFAIEIRSDLAACSGIVRETHLVVEIANVLIATLGCVNNCGFPLL